MCLDDQIISEYIDGELSEPWKSQLEEHLDWCESCKSRLRSLEAIKADMKESALEDSQVGYSQNRVMRYINANVLNQPKHTLLQKVHNFVSKRVFLPICTAVVTFCFCLIVFTSPEKVEEIVPTVGIPSLSIESITPVRLSDNYTTSQSLENYSIDEILRYLDDSGYDVTISVKSIKPINEGTVIKNDSKSLFNISPPISTDFRFGLSNKSYFTFKGNL